MEDPGGSTENPAIMPSPPPASKETASTNQDPTDPWKKYYQKREKYITGFTTCLEKGQFWLNDLYLKLELSWIQAILSLNALRRDKPHLAKAGNHALHVAL